MQITPSITFRGIRPSDALEADIRSRADKLGTLSRFITTCRVVVELTRRHQHSGNRFHVRIELAVPGEDIVVAHDASLHATAQDAELERATKQTETDPERKHALVAIREAFDVARRRLQDYTERQHDAVKARA